MHRIEIADWCIGNQLGINPLHAKEALSQTQLCMLLCRLLVPTCCKIASKDSRIPIDSYNGLCRRLTRLYESEVIKKSIMQTHKQECSDD
jgi:hypothetical protein